VRGAWLALFPVVAWAQGIVAHGADVFAATCGSGYCHGPRGAGGGAPKLAGRGFDEPYIISTTRAGILGTAMRGYGTVLARPDFNAVVAYVASLNGIEPRTAGAEFAARILPADAARGRELFFDSVRGFGRCSTCHLLDGWGIAVAAIHQVPRDVAALKNLAAAEVRTATVDGDQFPALVVSTGGRRTVLYDLTSLPPVVRTVDSSGLKVSAGSGWRHAFVMGAYRDADLESILGFLRAVAAP
jgi:mono/diheme cytochrome c family protein